jgi:hypothetical protein
MAGPSRSGPNDDSQEASEHDEPFVIEGPPEESFDEKYNKRMEFPLSLVGAILAHVCMAAVLFFFGFMMAHGDDKSGVPIKIVTISGFDESGEGSAGSGGDSDDPSFNEDKAPDSKNPQDLPDVKDLQDQLKTMDPSLQVEPKQLEKFNKLDKSLQKMAMNRMGSGDGQGHGYDGSQGKGPGGKGNDSTLGRNLRWTMRFTIRDGKSYLEQLRAVGFEILLPDPGSSQMTLIPDLKNWDVRRIATDADQRRLGNRVQFSDTRPDVCRSVSEYLGLKFVPSSITALLPEDLVPELAKLETGYNNKRAEDILETVFKVTVIDGKAQYSVARQALKK